MLAAAIVLHDRPKTTARVYAASRNAPGGYQEAADWPVAGGEAANDHYSSLSQINCKNVHKLVLAWKFDSGEKGGMQTNPLIVAGILYAYTPSQKVIALNAGTGKLLWKFDSGIDGRQPVRGLTYWSDGTDRRLFAAVMNYLYALDPGTGKPIPSFGEGGRIDLRKGLRGDYRSQSIALTSPGILYKDLIIVGGRNPETPPAPPGDIRAFDVHTGALRWRFRTIPHPGEPGYDTWPKDAWETAGAANNWAGMTLDTARGIVYVPTGSAVPDFYGASRVGNDLFADTLLALDAATGKLIWHFQGVHHDIWDRDFPSAPSLVTLRRNGHAIDAVAQTTKQGWLFVFDRANGQPLFPIEERKVPSSTVPGEVSSPTQPFPLAPEPYDNRQLLTEDMLTNRTPEAHAWAIRQFRTFYSAGPFVPLRVGQPTVVLPGFDGGAEWGGAAVDPRTGVIYVNANDIAATGSLVKNNPSAGLGYQTYQSECAVCHGESRGGSPPDFPSLIDIDNRLTAAQITTTIHGGRGRMPSFPNIQGSTLEALLNYLRTGEKGSNPAESTKELGHSEISSATGSSTSAPSKAGAVVYADHCAICHGDQKEGIPPSFPSLLGLGQRMSTEEVTQLIHKGEGRMPPFPNLQGKELDQLLAELGVSDSASAARTAPEDSAKTAYLFTGYDKFYDPQGYPAIAPPWGTLSAIDLNTGKYLWKISLGQYPELTAEGVPVTGTENYGGPIVTAGGVVFIGATIFDREFRALDSRSGKLLWKAQLPFSGLATPSTYMVDGKQYVVIAAGGGRNNMPSGGDYVAFRLP